MSGHYLSLFSRRRIQAPLSVCACLAVALCVVSGCGDGADKIAELKTELKESQAEVARLTLELDKIQPDKKTTSYAGEAGTLLEKLLLVKMSGTSDVTSHLVNVLVDQPSWKKGGAELLVPYEFSVLDDSTLSSYCAKTGRRYYARQGQGWWLQLADGSRLTARSDSQNEVTRVKPRKQKCAFKMTDDISAEQRKGMKFIYVPSLPPGSAWPKDELNRSKAMVSIDLGDIPLPVVAPKAEETKPDTEEQAGEQAGSLAGTTWRGSNSYGDDLVYRFHSGGLVEANWTEDEAYWTQKGNSVRMEFTYAVEVGKISAGRLKGKGTDEGGDSWTFRLKRK